MMRVMCALSASVAILLGLTANEAKQRAEVAEAKLAELHDTAERCNAVVVTCLGWQARVSIDLEMMANVIRGCL